MPKWIKDFFKNVVITKEDIISIVDNVSRTVSKNTTPEKDYTPYSKIITFNDTPNIEIGAMINGSKDPLILMNNIEESKISYYNNYSKQASKYYPNYVDKNNFGKISEELKEKNTSVIISAFKNSVKILDVKGNIKLIESRQMLKKRPFTILQEENNIEEAYSESVLPQKFSNDDFYHTYESFALGQKELFFDKLFFQQWSLALNMIKFQNLDNGSKKLKIKTPEQYEYETQLNEKFSNFQEKMKYEVAKSTWNVEEIWYNDIKQIKWIFFDTLSKKIEEKIENNINSNELEFSETEKNIVRNVYKENKKNFLKTFWENNESDIKKLYKQSLFNINTSLDNFEIHTHKLDTKGEIEGLDNINNFIDNI